MASSKSELTKASVKLTHISLKIQQLQQRKMFLEVMHELRDRAAFGETAEAAENQHEIDSINEELKELEKRKSELQKTHGQILNADDPKSDKEGSNISNQITGPVAGSSIFHVAAPPTVTAPVVILDLEKLPPHPCKTQCPECRSFITTETSTSVSSFTWMVCVMMAMIGCVAGCCLIPFCMDSFKSITHRCPRCRTSIKTLKKL